MSMLLAAALGLTAILTLTVGTLVRAHRRAVAHDRASRAPIG